MQGMSDIMALYAEGASSLCVNGSVDMLGRLAGISASKYTGYPPYDDAPKEGEFDWEGFTRNLAIGLGVVAVCAIGAAISIATLGAGSILAGAFIGAGIGALSTTAMKAGEEISTGNVRSAKEAFRDVGISAASGFITGAFGAKFPGAHRLTEGVVDTAVSAGERLAYAVFDDSMSWDEKWAYAFDPGQMVADFVTGVVIGEILDGIMAATQNKLRSIFANYDVTMREALESGTSSLIDIDAIRPKLKTQPDTAFFWSGRTDGIGGAENAANIAKSRGGVTLESTIEIQNIVMPEWDFNNPSTMEAWDLASGAYAEQVSGEIRAVIGSELRPGNIWENVELPRLKNNPNVTKITTIDPKTGVENVVFER